MLSNGEKERFAFPSADGAGWRACDTSFYGVRDDPAHRCAAQPHGLQMAEGRAGHARHCVGLRECSTQNPSLDNDLRKPKVAWDLEWIEVVQREDNGARHRPAAKWHRVRELYDVRIHGTSELRQ